MVRIPLCNSTRFGRGQSLVSAGLNNSPEGLKNSAIASSDRASILKQYITYGQGSAIGAKMSSGSDRASILKQYITYGQGSAIGAKMSSGSGLTPKSRQFSRRAR